MEENRIERAQRFSKIWWKSRADAGVSQEYMALGLGVSKKTIQNWEKGISSPTLFQGSEWFQLLGFNPIPYYYEFLYPDILQKEKLERPQNVEDAEISEALTLLVAEMPMDLKRILLYLFYGCHGSSPYSILQLLLAHLQSPLKDRVSHSATILQDYEIAEKLGMLENPDDIRPKVDFLLGAVEYSKGTLFRQNRRD